MMRIAALLLLAPLAAQAAPGDAESARAAAFAAWTDCTQKYVFLRALWPEPASDLADASFAACIREQEALVDVLTSASSRTFARQYMTDVRVGAREQLIRTVLERRHGQPEQKR